MELYWLEKLNKQKLNLLRVFTHGILFNEKYQGKEKVGPLMVDRYFPIFLNVIFRAKKKPGKPAFFKTNGELFFQRG